MNTYKYKRYMRDGSVQEMTGVVRQRKQKERKVLHQLMKEQREAI